MKTYSVKELAEMLKTNPETIRRWIRLGKLKAIQQSRKGGNVVTEQSLKIFLQSTPKYAKIAAGSIGIPALTASISIFAATILGGVLAQKISKDIIINNSQIPISEIERYIENSIKSSTKEIEIKEEEIKRIKQEIAEEEEKKAGFQKLLTEINSHVKGEDFHE